MILYINNQKYKVNVDNLRYIVNIPPPPRWNWVKLLASDDKILQSSDDSYLNVREEIIYG